MKKRKEKKNKCDFFNEEERWINAYIRERKLGIRFNRKVRKY